MFVFTSSDQKTSEGSKSYFKLYYRRFLLLGGLIIIAFMWKYFSSKKNGKSTSNEGNENIKTDNKNETASVKNNNPKITTKEDPIEKEDEEEIKRIINEIKDKVKQMIECLSEKENKIRVFSVLLSTFRVYFIEFEDMGESTNKRIIEKDTFEKLLKDIKEEGIETILEEEKINTDSDYLTLKVNLKSTLFHIKESFEDLFYVEEFYVKHIILRKKKRLSIKIDEYLNLLREIEILYYEVKEISFKMAEEKRLAEIAETGVPLIKDLYEGILLFVWRYQILQQRITNVKSEGFTDFFPLNQEKVEILKMNSYLLIDVSEERRKNIRRAIDMFTSFLKSTEEIEKIEKSDLKTTKLCR